MRYVIDSHSWINYFEGNSAGNKIKAIIENPSNDINTNVLNIAELSSFLSRKDLDIKTIETVFAVILSSSKIYDINIDFSKEAGFLHRELKKSEKNFGLIDAFVLLTAKKINAKIVTGDEHFRNVKEAVIIK